jgi:hypothetical protein
VPTERDARIERDAHLDDLASRRRQVVLLKIGAPDARLLPLDDLE